jgi:hypothetical protein
MGRNRFDTEGIGNLRLGTIHNADLEGRVTIWKAGMVGHVPRSDQAGSGRALSNLIQTSVESSESCYRFDLHPLYFSTIHNFNAPISTHNTKREKPLAEYRYSILDLP